MGTDVEARRGVGSRRAAGRRPRRSPSLGGARIWVTGERKGEAMARILRGHGAEEAVVVPTLETRVDRDPVWRAEQARRAVEADPYAAVFLTGIGARLLFEAAEEAGTAGRLRGVLERAFVVARGPKARSGLAGAGVEVDEEPAGATAAEVLEALTRHGVEGSTVLVQRHGRPERVLEDGIRELGGTLLTLDLYRYAPPPDLPGVRRMLDRCADGTLDAVVFTSPPAARGLMAAATETGQDEELRRASRERLLVAAVGGSTASALGERGVRVDVIPDDFTQPSLARALAARWQETRDERDSGAPEPAS